MNVLFYVYSVLLVAITWSQYGPITSATVWIKNLSRSKDSSTWSQANKTCVDRGQKLVRPDIYTQLCLQHAALKDAGSDAAFWIGMLKEDVSGTSASISPVFRWADCTPVLNSPMTQTINTLDPGTCVGVRTPSHHWGLYKCESPFQFTCESFVQFEKTLCTAFYQYNLSCIWEDAVYDYVQNSSLSSSCQQMCSDSQKCWGFIRGHLVVDGKDNFKHDDSDVGCTFVNAETISTCTSIATKKAYWMQVKLCYYSETIPSSNSFTTNVVTSPAQACSLDDPPSDNHLDTTTKPQTKTTEKSKNKTPLPSATTTVGYTEKSEEDYDEITTEGSEPASILGNGQPKTKESTLNPTVTQSPDKNQSQQGTSGDMTTPKSNLTRQETSQTTGKIPETSSSDRKAETTTKTEIDGHQQTTHSATTLSENTHGSVSTLYSDHTPDKTSPLLSPDFSITTKAETDGHQQTNVHETEPQTATSTYTLPPDHQTDEIRTLTTLEVDLHSSLTTEADARKIVSSTKSTSENKSSQTTGPEEESKNLSTNKEADTRMTTTKSTNDNPAFDPNAPNTTYGTAVGGSTYPFSSDAPLSQSGGGLASGSPGSPNHQPYMPKRQCSCKCQSKQSSRQGAEQSIVESLNIIKKTLEVATTNLSATRRKKESAQDTRLSAKFAGTVGIIILIVVAVAITLPDLQMAASAAISKFSSVWSKERF